MRAPGCPAPRVGFLGRLGSGNLGNDASLEVVLALVRRRRPDAVLDAMCSGPATLTDRYGLPAVALHHEQARGPAPWRVLAALAVDTVRISAWVRHHDVVLVPGMGTLESTLQERPWQMPWTLLVMALSGRVWGTRVALVGVGAGAVPEPVQRRLLLGAARLVHYRSLRDQHSRDQLRRMGLRTDDGVYPDVVLALPVPVPGVPEPGTVGVGVMAWSGGNAERARAGALHAAYVEETTRLVLLLLERGYRVRVLVGDADDVPVGRAVVERVGVAPDRLCLVASGTPAELVEAVSSVEVVVAARYHNVVSALRCATPVVALCYAPKHRELMDLMGLGDFCEDLRGLDAERAAALVEALHADLGATRARLAARLEELGPVMQEHFREVAGAVLGPRPGAAA